MRTNLLRASRMNGVLIPPAGDPIEIDDASAKVLIALKHAEEIPEGAPDDEPEKPKRGRPRKADTDND